MHLVALAPSSNYNEPTNEGTLLTTETLAPTRRGTTNRNERGSSYSRRSRRAYVVLTYQSNVPGLCRCYRCGVLLYNPDDHPNAVITGMVVTLPEGVLAPAFSLTIDRIIPGCDGGTYRRNNIRPACGGCNSETGGPLANRKAKK